jgi:copper(I)-binding protein
MRSFDWKNICCASAAGLAVALPQISTAPAQAADYDVGSIHITAPWARATPKGASSGAAYITIAHKGTVPDRVTCMSSDVSAACQIHTMAMERGVMKMRPVEGGLEIKPGETVTLKASGLHLMLMDLKRPLEQGKVVEATLQFEKAGTIKIEFPVAAIGAAAPGTPAGDSHDGMMHMDKR